MPVQKSTILRDRGDLIGPTGAPQNDSMGNPAQGPSTDTLIQAAVKIGLFPMSVRRDWIKTVAGAPTNLRDWWVAVPGNVAVKIGYAFVVAAGANPGTYRIKQVTQGPSRTSLTLCVANKEL